MARWSTGLYRYGKETYETYGFGNTVMFGLFCLIGSVALLGLSAWYFPAFAETINTLMIVLCGGGTFLGISLISGLSLGGVIFGLLAGLFAAGLSTSLCSLAFFMAPPIAFLFILPNVLAGGACLLGAVCSVVEACFCCSNRDENESAPVNHTHRHHSRNSDVLVDPDVHTGHRLGLFSNQRVAFSGHNENNSPIPGGPSPR